MQQYIIRFVFFAVPSRSQIEVADAFDHSREIFAAYEVPGGFGADGFGKGQGQRGRAWEGSTEGQVLASWLLEFVVFFCSCALFLVLAGHRHCLKPSLLLTQGTAPAPVTLLLSLCWFSEWLSST